MLAQGGGHFQIEIVERHYAVDSLGAGQVADGQQRIVAVPGFVLVRHVKDIVDAFARPLGFVAQAERGDEEDARPLPLGFAHEVVALFVAGQTEEG